MAQMTATMSRGRDGRISLAARWYAGRWINIDSFVQCDQALTINSGGGNP
jgi:hypothetical protein